MIAPIGQQGKPLATVWACQARLAPQRGSLDVPQPN